MLGPDHPLADLQAQAALASGWPTLHVLAPTEAAVLDARARVEAILGALPQADVIEPFDPSDPAESWELRVDLPGLPPAAWDVVRAAVPTAVLVPGTREGARAADDLGHRLVDEVDAGGVIARLHVHAIDGGVLLPEVRTAAADAEITRIEEDLAALFRAAGLDLAFHSARGPGTLQPVVHRAGGRFGVQVHVAPTAFDGLSGDAVLALRQRVVGAVAALVHARRDDPVRLAPDLLWDLAWGLSVTAWIVGPAAPGLPGDDRVRPGLQPFLGTLTRWIGGFDGLVAELEIQVVPASPDQHDPVAHQVAGRLAHDTILPGRPRWLVVDDVGGSWHAFCPTWRVVAEDLDATALFDVLDAVADAPGVFAVRVVPGEPTGMGESWDLLDPVWRPGAARCFVRLRDGIADRDRLVLVADREPDARDEALAASLRGVPGLLPRDGGFGRPVRDDGGRAGVELVGEPSLFREADLARTLDALGAIDHPDLCSIAHWGYVDARPMMVLWYRRS